MKLVYLYSSIKMMHGPINIRKQRYYLSRKNVTALQLNVFATGVHTLLFTINGRSAFSSFNHSQGYLQTSQ